MYLQNPEVVGRRIDQRRGRRRRGRRNFCAASAICRLLDFHIGRARFPFSLFLSSFLPLCFVCGDEFHNCALVVFSKDDNGEAPVSVDGREKSVG